MAYKKVDMKNPPVMPERTWQHCRRVYLDVLRATGSRNLAASEAGQSAKFFRRKCEQDEQFAQEVDDAAREAFGKLECAARKRAIDGVRKYVISRGQLVPNPDYVEGVSPKEDKWLTERVYSDSLTQFLLTGQDPDKNYGRHRVEIDKPSLEDILDERDDMKPDEPGPKAPVT